MLSSESGGCCGGCNGVPVVRGCGQAMDGSHCLLWDVWCPYAR
jgi:hypothetical protein